MGFAFDDQPVRMMTGTKLPKSIADHVTAGRKVIAHNMAFEATIWNTICVPQYGWPPLDLKQLSCTMVRAYTMGLPGKLEKAAAAVGLKMQKDMKGHRLMLKLSQPKHTKDGSVQFCNDPEDFAALYRYCAQDVEVERALDKRLLELMPQEKEVWMADQVINGRGVLVATRHAMMAKHIVRSEQDRLNEELRAVTGNEIATYNAHLQFKAFLKSRGIQVPGVDKGEVIAILERRDIPRDVRRALEIRQEAAKSSTAKIEAMLRGVSSDERLRGIFQYHGAGTGRWAGRRVQPQNLPKSKLDQAVIEEIFTDDNMDAEVIRAFYGKPMDVISQCLRGLLIAAPGKKLMAMDYSAIEARVLAWLADDEEVLDIFATHGKIYEQAASEIFGIATTSVSPSQRQVGKVAVLALGYQGGVGAFQNMAAAYNVKMEPAFDYLWAKASPDERDNVINRYEAENERFPIKISKKEWLASELTKVAWRGAHPRIVGYWTKIEEAARQAIVNDGKSYVVGKSGRHVTFLKKGSFLFCRLPSGRCLSYAYPEVTEVLTPWGQKKPGIRYMAENSTTHKWERTATYGGSLVENITQAVARDLLADAIVFLEKAHWPIVLHVHDEVVVEVDAREKLADFQAIVGNWAIPAWAKDLPMAVEGWEGKRYRK